VLAHGVGARADLPVPVPLTLVGAGAAVLVSFVALGLLWPTSRLRGGAAGRPLPDALQAVLDSPLVQGALRLVALALTSLVVVVALVGPASPPTNLGVYAFYITFWVGLVPASLLLGGVWRAVNPLRTLCRAVLRLSGPAPGEAQVARVGMWPAAVSVLAFAELELAYPNRSDPRVVGVFLLVYGLVHLTASLWYGEEWFARGDGFEVYSTLLGRLSPLGRRDDGRWVLRSPFDGADATPVLPGLSGVVVALVGSTAFDGITRTAWWQNGPGIAGDAAGLPPTLGLLVTVAAVGLLYAGATGLVDRITGTSGAPGLFAHSLVPVAAGYAVAHYFSLLLLDGQLTWILASDPFQTGLDLFGTARNTVDYTALSPRTISLVQVAAIVVGHVVAVVLAHDRAVRLASGRRARTAQYPLLAVMVGLTVGGLALLLG
jgi:hypothetical protein